MLGSLAERLASADAAYDRLMTGAAVVEVQDQNGERVRYNAASARQLATYCAEMRRQIGGRPAPTTIRFQTRKF